MDPRPRRVPENLQTERLLMRPVGPGDGPALRAAVEASWQQLRRVAPWARRLPTVEQEEEFCRQARRRFRAGVDLAYLILERESGEVVGSAGLHHIDWEVPRMEIGYWVRSDREGRGYATEAARALVETALGPLRAVRVELRTFAGNDSSRRVAEKLGFRLEAILRRHDRDPLGGLQDTCVYVRLADEPLTGTLADHRGGAG
jgi:RimJ/RimL family protein N-acetyltransferase